MLWQVDTILFSLLVLRGLCDSQGRMWRCHPNQLYAVEVTLPNRDNTPERDKIFPESRTVSLMKLMPSVFCPSPRKALNHLAAEQSCMLLACILELFFMPHVICNFPLLKNDYNNYACWNFFKCLTFNLCMMK